MTTLVARGSGTPATTGTTWASLTNAVDGTAGTNPATYATYTNAVASAVATIEITNYGFSSSIASTDTLNSVSVSVRHLENNTGRFASVTYQAFDGATAIGTAQTATLGTAATNATATFAATLTQLRSATFKVRVTITGAASTQSRVFSLDHIDVTADYTIVPPAITQAAYRWYDDGTETGAVALAAQDTPATGDVTVNDGIGQLRVRLQSTDTIAIGATDDWQLRWERTAGTAVLADSYPSTNQNAGAAMGGTGYRSVVGESFLGTGGPLTRAGFFLNKNGVPNGVVSAALYAHTGTFGTGTGLGTGSPLATATTSIASTSVASGPYQWYYFDFDGTYTLTNGTPYVVAVTTTNTGTGVNWLGAGLDDTTPTHAGSGSGLGASWSTLSADLIFEVYAKPVTTGNVAAAGGTVNGYNSPNLTDGAATTNRLGAGSGSFVAGKVSETGLVTDLGWTANNYTELLYSLDIVNTDVANGDTLRFRVLRNGATTGLTYTQVPTINITKAAGAVTGVATGQLGVAGTALGVRDVTGTATGSLTLTGAAAGAPSTPGVEVTGVATGSLAVAGTALGTRGTPGTATGNLTVVGAAFGLRVVPGVAAGTITVVGAAVGQKTVTGLATGSLAIVGTALGTKDVTGLATGTITIAGTASGVRDTLGVATGQLAVTGTASGTKDVTGVATGSLAVVGTAAAARTVLGVATGSITLSSTALGQVAGAAVGNATGTIVVTGLATGTRTTTGLATGSLTLAGTATGAVAVTGVATGSITINGTASGTRTPAAIVGQWNLAAIDGLNWQGNEVVEWFMLVAVERNGTATGVLDFGATAAGSVGHPATATGSLAIVATASGAPASAGTDVLLENFNDLSRWTTIGGVPTIVTGRTGTALSVAGTTATVAYSIPALNQSATITAGCAFRISNLGGNRGVLRFWTGGAVQNVVYAMFDGQLTVDRSGTQIAASAATGLVVINTWYYLEAQITLHDTAGSVIVKLNGVERINATGLDTRQSGTVYDQLRLGPAGSGNTQLFDDLYITTGAGAPFKGDITVP